jgi:UDP-N-acetylglucosamine 3-dehydrogenase
VTKAPLRVALLGCGGAAVTHSRLLRAEPGVEVHFASRSADRAREFARRHGGTLSFGSYEAALASRDVDAVLVATPPAQHLEQTLSALAAGKDVIVEKPAFLRAADFDRVAAAAAPAGRRVLVAENYFYKPLAVALRRVIGRGDLGPVRLVLVNALKHQKVSGWREDPALSGGGALLEGGVHWVNFMAHLGLETLGAKGSPRGLDPGRERGLVAVFDYAGGASGVLAYSWEIRSVLHGLRLSRIYGLDGTAAFETNGLFLATAGRRRRLTLPGLSDITGRKAMTRDFVRALRREGEPEMDLRRARRDIELIEEIYTSLGAAAPAERA